MRACVRAPAEVGCTRCSNVRPNQEPASSSKQTCVCFCLCTHAKACQVRSHRPSASVRDAFSQACPCFCRHACTRTCTLTYTDTHARTHSRARAHTQTRWGRGRAWPRARINTPKNTGPLPAINTCKCPCILSHTETCINKHREACACINTHRHASIHISRCRRARAGAAAVGTRHMQRHGHVWHSGAAPTLAHAKVQTEARRSKIGTLKVPC